MARIKKGDVVEQGIFTDLNSQADLAIKKLTELSVVMQKDLKIQVEMAKATKETAKGVRDLAQIEEQSVRTLKEKEKVDKQILSTRQKLTQVNKQQRANLAELRTEEQRRNKIAREEAKLTNQNLSAYEKLQIKIKQLTDRYRNLVIAEGKETRETKRLKEQILQLNKVRDAANRSLGMHQDKVGQYGNAINKLRGLLGQLGLAFGVFAVLRNAFGIVKDHEEAMASLAAITGLSGAEFDKFSNKVTDVADSTKQSATDVAKAFELIASAQPALLKDADALAAVTEQAIILNKAIKGDLAETSLALVGVMNQFGLEASESARVINALAAGSQAGAATVLQINESMVKFGTTASILNVSVEESVGLIETLGEKAIFGAEAGTNLKNVMLIMSSIDVLPPKALAQLEKYGVDTDIVKDTTISFAERLEELSKIGQDTTAIMQVFGKENSTAATVLLNSTETVKNMTAAVTDSNVANEQAATNSDTLATALKELKAGWDNYIIGASESGGITDKLKNIVKFLANNLELILNTLFTLVKAFVVYKTAVFAQTIALKAYNLVQTLTTKGLKALTTATKLNPFAAIATALIVVLPLITDFVKNLFSAKEELGAVAQAQKVVNTELAKESAKLQTRFDLLRKTNPQSEERLRLINEINSTYGTTLENLEDETAFAKQLTDVYNDLNAQLEKKIKIRVFEAAAENLIAENIRLEKSFSDLKAGLLTDDDLKDLAEEFDTDIIGLAGGDLGNLFKKNKRDIDDLLNSITELSSVTDVFPTIDSTIPEGTGGTGSGVTKEQKKLDELEKFKRKQAEILKQLEIDLRKQGADEEFIKTALADKQIELMRQTGSKIIELDFKDKSTLKEFELEYLQFVDKNQTERVDLIKDANEQIIADGATALNEFVKQEEAKKEAAIKAEEELKRKQEEAIKRLRENISESLNMVAEFYEKNLKLIDKQIEAQQEIVDKSKTREEEIKELAKEKQLNAEESINAEREIQKKAILQQQDLERKRQRTEALIAALQLLASKINSGDGNPVQNVKSDIFSLKSFIEGNFISGTKTTLGDALGYNPGVDSHFIAADNNEAIFNPSQTRALGIGKGGNSTDDIVDFYRNGILANNARHQMAGFKIERDDAIMSDPKLLKKIDQLINETKKKQNDVGKMAFDSVIGAITYETRRGDRYIFKTRK